MTYWNVVKRITKTKEYVKIIKSYKCSGACDWDTRYKAEWFASFRNFFSSKYYYVVEFDFE
jgi:hypothetical protein